jgi:hypothetical protein
LRTDTLFERGRHELEQTPASPSALFATRDGTKRYFQRLERAGRTLPWTSVLGSTELTVSRIGFGTYRVHEFEPDHREALKRAILKGCNLIDCAINYSSGSAERLVGDVLQDMFQEETLRRDEIVVVTKVGYIQGDLLKDGKLRKSRFALWPEVQEVSQELWHCIHPDFIREQITESLRRTKLQVLDGVLLHNPETYFKSSTAQREEYYRRIEKAFRHLEQEVADRRIRFFGVSSNTFGEPESRSDHTSFLRLRELANSVGRESHFRVVQFPLNLFEAGAALMPNNNREAILTTASKAGFGVLANRPFNSYSRERLIRLTSFPSHDAVEAKGVLHQSLATALELEKQAPGHPKAHDGLRWAHALRDTVNEMDDVLAWKAFYGSRILPSVRQGLAKVPREKQSWRDEYEHTLSQLFRAVTACLEVLAQERSQSIIAQILTHRPELKDSPTLSRMVMRTYLSLPQVSAVLVGMRTPEYVEDTLLADPLLPEAQAVELLGRFQKYRS